MFRKEDQKEKINKDQIRLAIQTNNKIPSDKTVDIVFDWLNFYNEDLLLTSGINNADNIVAAIYHKDVIYLLGDVYPTIMYAPKMLLNFVDQKHVHIEDILVKSNNGGNGSILMAALLELAKHKKIDLITGDLSPVDNDHRDRRNHFYQKFGFTITENMVIKRVKNDQ